ncbi:hypothetical protein K461DRAFT_272707 [Myriangium duriaei CBS 260.36]|uniref:Uncharacterized protein n=1 Tax=Myriangium duriaei CBS 260.36 TaxID=1168546 RepID=A0A9P4MNX3_9PEZI|nr:hypothetical protein K461DRAFT_272707 [Myriangium duriaei CBS 260.36]
MSPEAFRAEHADFLNGMHELYRSLVLMGYIEADDIAWEPESNDHLAHYGYSREAIALIGAMPYPKNSYLQTLEQPPWGPFVPITPGSGPISYSDKDRAYESRLMVYDDLLPPSAVKITYFSVNEGELYIYDMVEKSIITWGIFEKDEMERYHEHPRAAAALVLSGWISKLETLEWIPWTFGDWHRIDTRMDCKDWSVTGTPHIIDELQNGRSSHQKYGKPLPDVDVHASERAWLNNDNSRRLIFEQCGWPDRSRFDRAEFLRRRDEWHQGQLDILQNDEMLVSPEGDVRCEENLNDLQFAFARNWALRHYLRETAGSYAV